MEGEFLRARLSQMLKAMVSMLGKMQDGGEWMGVEQGLSCLICLLHGCQIDDKMSENVDPMLLRQCSELALPRIPQLQSAFFSSPYYPMLSDLLLSIAEIASHRQNITAMTREIIDAAPAAIALSTLVSTLKCISAPPTMPESRVLSVGAEQAADILRGRFANGEGIEELVVHLAYQVGEEREVNPVGSQEMDVDSIAGLLLSLHENDLLNSKDVYTGIWLSTIIRSLFVILGLPESHWTGHSASHLCIAESALVLLATTINRACIRGHSKAVSTALVDLHLKGDADQSLVKAIMAKLLVNFGRCLEKLISSLLSVISQRISLQLPDQPEDQYCLVHRLSNRVRIKDATLESASTLAVFLGGNLLASSSQEMRYCLLDRMLGSSTMSSDDLFILTSFLASDVCPWPLEETLHKTSVLWSDEKSLSLTPITQQGFLTHALGLLLSHFIHKGSDVRRMSSFLPLLLKGVSHRLGASLVAQRRQAMRIGRLVSFLTPGNSEPLFEEQQKCGELNWAHEELWPGAVADRKPPLVTLPQLSVAQPKQPSPAALKSEEKLNAAISTADVDSDNECSSSDQEDGLHSYDVTESKEIEDLNKDPKALQLRSIASSLQKADDPKLVLTTLGRLEALIRCHPEELASSASDLVRSLLHCRIPEWAEKEAKNASEDPQGQRICCLAALASLSPVASGDTMLSELYSPHLDTFQRLLILDSLTKAAEEMSGSLKSLAGSEEAKSSLNQSGSQGTIAQDSSAVGKTRVWGKVALRKRGEPAPATHKNQFTGFAMRWAASILRNVDVVSHGVDLLNRDSMVLGRIISCLATFAECASHTPPSLPLGVLILDLIRSPKVHAHQDPYIRRAALLAVGQVLASLPPASVAQAMLSSYGHHEESEGVEVKMIGGINMSSLVKLPDLNAISIRSDGKAGGKWDAQDCALLQGLEFVQSWSRKAQEYDIDPTAKAMAGACVNIQAGLAKQALECLAQSEAGTGK